MNLYTVTIFWKTRPDATRLTFRDAERAKSQAAIVSGSVEMFVRVEDDFSSVLDLDLSTVAGVLFTDLAEEANANIEMQLLSAHAQIRGMKQAEADPVIKEHQQRLALMQNLTNGARVHVPPGRE